VAADEAAGQTIDRLLTQAGWALQEVRLVNLQVQQAAMAMRFVVRQSGAISGR
jgi:hypothetical protein